MNLYNFIQKRKSTRKYDMTPLDTNQLEKITDYAKGLKALCPDIQTDFEIVNTVKNPLPIKAPHYFLISSEQVGDYLQNIGFMWQQMDLYLASLGLGSCWLGMAKPDIDLAAKHPFVIALAFGKAEGSPYRELNEFKRKPLSEISKGEDDRLVSAQLAPSATNSQNWFFDSTSGYIDIYQKKLNPVQMLIYDKMNKIDIGIAVCHLYVATKNKGCEFTLEKASDKNKNGYIYFATVK